MNNVEKRQKKKYEGTLGEAFGRRKDRGNIASQNGHRPTLK